MPPNIIAMMDRFGRFAIEPLRDADSASEVWRETQNPLVETAQRSPSELIGELTATCVPAGGWAVFGAERTVKNLLGRDARGEVWNGLLDAAIDFLRAKYVPANRLALYEWDRWCACGGGLETWIPNLRPPSRQQASITPLADGETRQIARVGPQIDTNFVVVRQEGDLYAALVDARWSYDHPDRSLTKWKTAPTLFDLYRDVGGDSYSYYWVDVEFAPYLRNPQPLW